MKHLGCFVMLCVSFFSSAFGDFQENKELAQTLGKNHVRLVVLCNFQGTNNVLDIVTSSRSPSYELSNYGLASLKDAIVPLSAQGISHIYTTPAFRAQQTANLLGKAFGLAPASLTLDSRLAMQNFGLADGEDYDLYKQRFASEEEMLEKGAPGGEAGIEVFNRLQEFLMSLTTLQDQTVLIVTHGFNFCYISKCLTGKFGAVPPTQGTFLVYDFSSQ